jgi:protocatechuate 3,4-dioxygenase beta subunit
LDTREIIKIREFLCTVNFRSGEGFGGMDGSASHTALLDNLAGRVTRDRQDRVVSAFLTCVGHVHEAIQDLNPSPEEWRAVIDFLTEVGHSADARRQEWVLLADVIGASTLIEDMHSVRPDGATPNTLAGPFYRPDVPEMANGGDISRDGIGAALLVGGKITDLQGQGISSAMIEVWQANSFGVYENQQPDLQPEFNLRGRFAVDQAGAFSFRTVRPHGYDLPGDGPVGRLMQRVGVKLQRPAHLHFRVTAPGFQTLTTHISDRADPSIGCDALFCVKPALLGDIQTTETGGGTQHSLAVQFRLAPSLPSHPASNS